MQFITPYLHSDIAKIVVEYASTYAKFTQVAMYDGKLKGCFAVDDDIYYQQESWLTKNGEPLVYIGSRDFIFISVNLVDFIYALNGNHIYVYDLQYHRCVNQFYFDQRIFHMKKGKNLVLEFAGLLSVYNDTLDQPALICQIKTYPGFCLLYADYNYIIYKIAAYNLVICDSTLNIIKQINTDVFLYTLTWWDDDKLLCNDGPYLDLKKMEILCE
jgi:hypothetical protein